MGGGEPINFADWHAINSLLLSYADSVDAGRWHEVASMFQHATYRVAHSDGGTSTYEGSAQVQEFCEQTRVHADGTPRTKHVVTNVAIDVDGEQASAHSYATVFQQTDVLPLQPIASGRYIDRFERVDGSWRFVDRLITGFLLGDRSEHVPWHDGAPAEAES
ncbi:MAG: nuclear transport factor 2 family protein [Acidimicrobiales bacterium]